MHQNTRLPTARHLQKQAPHGSPLQREESTPEVHLKSMQEFLGKMREKYAIGIVEDYGGEGTCNRTANYSCMDNFLKERAGKSTPPCTAPLPVPAYQEVSAHAETSYSSSYAPTNPCCADLRADFEGLKIMVDDLQYENRSLRKDLEEYTASTGALITSLQAELRRLALTSGSMAAGSSSCARPLQESSQPSQLTWEPL